MKKLNYWFFAGITLLAMVSCDKTSDTLTAEEQLNTQLVINEQLADNAGTETDAIVEESYLAGTNTLRSASTTLTGTDFVSDCAVIAVDTIAKTMSVDFGTSGCVGKDGKVRTGKIVVTTTSKFYQNRTIHFVDYTVNGKLMKGIITKTFTARLPKVKAVINEELTILFPNKTDSVYRKADLTRVYDYNRLATVRDDKVYTWGTAQFTHITGIKSTKTIPEKTPLVYSVAAKEIVSGIQLVNRNNKTFTTDFGNGIADGLATVTDGDKTWIIRLK